MRNILIKSLQVTIILVVTLTLPAAGLAASQNQLEQLSAEIHQWEKSNPTSNLAETGITSRISLASDGTQGDNESVAPAISADGRFVAFTSLATNLVSGDTNGAYDIFLHDTQTGETTRVSISSDGAQGDGNSWNSVISADGRFVAFHSFATNLVSDDTNNYADVFLHDTQTGETTRVSISSEGVEGDNISLFPAISGDGRFLAFESLATNLVSDDTNNKTDVFLHDTKTGETTRVSINSEGVEGNYGSNYPAISADGRFVAFYSFATNLVSNDTNNNNDVFLHDTQTGETTRVSINSEGVEGNYGSEYPTISADGRFIAFESYANNLVNGDTNQKYEIFLHDTQTGETTRVSISSEGVEGDNESGGSTISADGRFVVFHSLATNLVSDDTNDDGDIFRHDTHTGETIRVSLSSEGDQGDYDSYYPAISADGRFVAFESYATNLVSDDTNSKRDVFLHDSNFVSIVYLPVILK